MKKFLYAAALFMSASACHASGPVEDVAGTWQGQVWQAYGQNNGRIPKYYFVGTLRLTINRLGHTQFTLENNCSGRGLTIPTLGGYVLDMQIFGCPYPDMDGNAHAHLTKKGDIKIVRMASPITKTQTVGKLTMIRAADEQGSAASLEFGKPGKPLKIREQ